MRLLTPDHMSYEIDRNPALEPSLLQMVNKTLQILTKATENSEKGFFLMIEGSRIDMAAHRYSNNPYFLYIFLSNDAAGHLHEIMMYQQTIEHVKSYIDSRDDSIMISVQTFIFSVLIFYLGSRSRNRWTCLSKTTNSRISRIQMEP